MLTWCAVKGLTWPNGSPIKGLKLVQRSGHWTIQVAPAELPAHVKAEMANLESLEVEAYVATCDDAKFLLAALEYAKAFLMEEQECLDFHGPQLIELLKVLFGIVAHSRSLSLQALEWDQKGRPEVSSTKGQEDLRDACVIIFEALGEDAE
jgi:hypothetical protein